MVLYTMTLTLVLLNSYVGLQIRLDTLFRAIMIPYNHQKGCSLNGNLSAIHGVTLGSHNTMGAAYRAKGNHPYDTYETEEHPTNTDAIMTYDNSTTARTNLS
ncbi:hypothetical protein BDV39DRAFT_185418 [Aspergillus sergii]|uniref:Uncharacterized protein n=1 Tax=Aspergillus sergii TaxID=1034303 RepID=A0A5N6WLD1_9EURO|nr:hypothetical protein BDV39DRAFT_185418 [Aspergillus sergii]